jgi:phosphatidylglycerophosphatase C
LLDGDVDYLLNVIVRVKAAFFDLDGTLTVGDSFPRFLAALRGWPLTWAGYALACIVGPFTRGQGAFDTRGRIKLTLLWLLARGVRVADATAAGTTLKNKITWNSAMLERLRRHHAEGHRVVIVTGAPTIYLANFLDDLPIDEIIGSELEIRNGRLTGRLAGVNCVREAKAAIVQHWLTRHQPEETWGYGNAPHDLPMLKLVTHATVV